ncbi:hypothetical protein AZE42_10857, partial [Rhizopogon vesiculosus]
EVPQSQRPSNLPT